MTRLVLRGLAARKVRAFLTALAVLLGVAMVAGSYVLTDTINQSFERIFEQGEKGVAVEVTPHENIKQSDENPPPFSESLLTKVRAVDGVKIAVGGIFDQGSILGRNNKPISTHGAPNFITSVVPRALDPFNYVQGGPPRRDGEVALDKFTADRHKFKVGDRIGIVGRAPKRTFKLVGIARYGNVASFGGASVAAVTLKDAQELTANAGRLQSIEIGNSAGISDQELKKRIRAVLPGSVDVRTGAEQAAKQSSDQKKNFSVLTTILVAFGFIALFVGAFIIFNTFSITVAQRTKEFAMLRTLGASRRQVLASVFTEAFLIGVFASIAGLLAGIGYAKGIGALFKAIGVDLPSQGTVVLTRTIVVALLVGVLLTVAASLFPAIRATRVAPLEALREGSGAQAGPRGRRYAIGAVLVVLGFAAMAYGLLGVSNSDSALTLIGLGTLLVFLGAAMLSPRLVPPIARVASAPLVRFRGLPGQLARENTMRNPARTAVTAAALMIGIALVTFVAVFAAGLKAGINSTIDKNFRGDFVLQNTDGFSPIPPAAGDAVAKLPGVATVSHWRTSVGKVTGVSGRAAVTGLDPATAGGALALDWDKGSPATLTNLKPGQAIVDNKYGKKHKFGVGSTLKIRTPTNVTLNLEVVGSVKDRADFLGDVVVPLTQIERDFDQRQDTIAVINLEKGASVAGTKKRITTLLDHQFPTIKSLNQRELKASQSKGFNQLVNLIYGLLSLAVIISIFGIVNTLVLTIHERTRELGLLRAVGMSRRQVRRLIRYESVVTALIGAILGAVLGFFFAVVVSRPIADEGFVLKVPVVSIATFLILAALAGVLAAIPPARRASRLDVLEALAYE
ncbi:MAG: putative transport system permease protein [Thermoleophilaceae bacterium]|nr:putative transport system permease protein [Thermoleophilaceae bacterium]